MKRFSALIAAGVLCGCSVIYTTQPVGDKPANIQSQQAEWEGTWVHPDGALTVRVMDGSNGVLKVGWMDKDGDGLKSETADLYLRQHGDWMFANLRPNDKDQTNGYIWARIKKQDRLAILWGPDTAKFKQLVEDGKLPGTTNGSNVALGTLSSNQLDLITSDTNGVLFDWDEPFILIKMSK
jgi:hypothetical protein